MTTTKTSSTSQPPSKPDDRDGIRRVLLSLAEVSGRAAVLAAAHEVIRILTPASSSSKPRKSRR